MQGRSSSDPDILIPISAEGGEQGNRALVGEPAHQRAGHAIAVFSYTIPVLNAAMDAADTSVSMNGNSLKIVLPAAAITFASSLGLGIKFSAPGFIKTSQMIQNREYPVKWTTRTPLTRGKEYLAAGSALALTGYSAFSESVLAYHFVATIPSLYKFDKMVNPVLWTSLSATGAGFIGLNIIFGQGVATLKASRRILGGTRRSYQSTASKIISETGGVVLGTFTSVNDVLSTFGGMMEVFVIESDGAKIAIFVTSTLNGVSDYSVNGIFIVQCLQTFIESFSPDENEVPAYRQPVVMITFLLSLASGGLLSYINHNLYKSVLEDVAESAGINAPEITTPIITTIIIGTAAANLVNITGSIYPLYYLIVNNLGDLLSGIYNRAAACFHEDTEAAPANTSNDHSDDETTGLLEAAERSESEDLITANNSEEESSTVVEFHDFDISEESDAAAPAPSRHPSTLFQRITPSASSDDLRDEVTPPLCIIL